MWYSVTASLQNHLKSFFPHKQEQTYTRHSILFVPVFILQKGGESMYFNELLCSCDNIFFDTQTIICNTHEDVIYNGEWGDMPRVIPKFYTITNFMIINASVIIHTSIKCEYKRKPLYIRKIRGW